MPEPDFKTLIKGVADSDPMMRIGNGMRCLDMSIEGGFSRR